MAIFQAHLLLLFHVAENKFSLIRSAHTKATEKEKMKERVTLHESQELVLEKRQVALCVIK